MKHLKNEKGVALVMVLVLALIGLAFVSAMLFMVTQGTQSSGAMRMVRTAEDAGFGGGDLATDFIKRNLPKALKLQAWDLGIATRGNGISSGSTDACLIQKLTTTRPLVTGWTSCLTSTNTSKWIDPWEEPDLTVTLGNYTAYGKIVDTVTGNTDPGGILPPDVVMKKDGAAAVGDETASSAAQIPYLYTIEVKAQATNNPKERANISVLYAR
jgi:hypothetical protein